MSLIKKNMPNPSNGAANASVSSVTSDDIQVATSILALKSIQDPGNGNNMDVRSLPWKMGVLLCLGFKRCSEKKCLRRNDK